MFNKTTFALCVAAIAMATVLTADQVDASRISLDRAKIRIDSTAVISPPSPVVTQAPGRAASVDRAKIRIDGATLTPAPTSVFNGTAPGVIHAPNVTQAPAPARGGLDRAKIRIDSVDVTSSPSSVVTQAPGRAGVDRAKIMDSITVSPTTTPVDDDAPVDADFPVATQAPVHGRGGLDRAKIMEW
ncbi:hypothetical protein Gpo141_00014451 [Globisporangium polare]